MITPRFSVRQDEKQVYITIHAPHVRAQALEFDVDEYQFKFFASPYYLRLTFSGKVQEDDASTASYDAASGDISVVLSKQAPGEQFENLDMLTSLLATSRERDAGETKASRPVIEEIGGSISVEDQLSILKDEDFDWELPQNLPQADSDGLMVGQAKYGFNEQYSGFLVHVHSTANEVNEVSDPEHQSAEERRKQRVATEDAKFDDAYYMENYVNDDDEISSSIRFKTQFYLMLRKLQKAKKEATFSELAADQAIAHNTDIAQETRLLDMIEFTDSEKKTMMDLPRKSHIISDRQAVYLGMVDILFSYCLDHRINYGEPTVESAWAIGAVSATFSNLEQFSTLHSVLISCFRRGLAYPLYRNWELCEKALEDVYVILKLGRRAVLKALLEIKSIFDKHDIYYIYSKIYIDDYCVWVQTLAGDKAIRSLAHKVHHFEVDKDDIGWHLDALEDLALMSSESEQENEGEGQSEDAGFKETISAALEESDAMAGLSLDVQSESDKADNHIRSDPNSRKKMVQIIGEDDASGIDQETIIFREEELGQDHQSDLEDSTKHVVPSLLRDIAQSVSKPESNEGKTQQKKGPLIEML